MNKSNVEPPILLDSDVVRHFISGGQINLLSSIYPGRFVMLDIVKNELCKSKQILSVVLKFLTDSNIPVIPFPTDAIIIMEYAYLTRDFGDGESACMAVARFEKKFVASSNLKDISVYCQKHEIPYLTTMDILFHGFSEGLISKDDCDLFIKKVLSKGSKLPCKTLDEFIELRKK